MNKKQTSKTKNKHQPVLLQEVLDNLTLPNQGAYLDFTAGRGGHAQAILSQSSGGSAVLVDRDTDAITYLNEIFKDNKNVRLIHKDYLSAAIELKENNESFDAILLDLGVSSPQFDTPERGFSLKAKGPLDMRMDMTQPLSAQDLINHMEENELADLIYNYGDERFARRIARAIVAKRPLSDTAELAQIVSEAIPQSRGRIHPATKTFQALRIAVNDELNQLESVLQIIPDLLNTNGRVAIISFHSLEDRLVKVAFKSDERLSIVTKKPLTGSSESFTNPRARSAKLRVAVKQK